MAAAAAPAAAAQRPRPAHLCTLTLRTAGTASPTVNSSRRSSYTFEEGRYAFGEGRYTGWGGCSLPRSNAPQAAATRPYSCPSLPPLPLTVPLAAPRPRLECLCPTTHGTHEIGAAGLQLPRNRLPRILPHSISGVRPQAAHKLPHPVSLVILADEPHAGGLVALPRMPPCAAAAAAASFKTLLR